MISLCLSQFGYTPHLFCRLAVVLRRTFAAGFTLVQRLGGRARWPGFMSAYRLAFNAITLDLLLPIFWMIEAYAWPTVWQWHGINAGVDQRLGLMRSAGFCLVVTALRHGEDNRYQRSISSNI